MTVGEISAGSLPFDKLPRSKDISSSPEALESLLLWLDSNGSKLIYWSKRSSNGSSNGRGKKLKALSSGRAEKSSGLTIDIEIGRVQRSSMFCVFVCYRKRGSRQDKPSQDDDVWTLQKGVQIDR